MGNIKDRYYRDLEKVESDINTLSSIIKKLKSKFAKDDIASAIQILEIKKKRLQHAVNI